MSDLTRFVSHLRCLSEPEPVPCQDPTAFQHDGTLRHSLALSCPPLYSAEPHGTDLLCRDIKPGFCRPRVRNAAHSRPCTVPPRADVREVPGADVRRVRMLCTWAMQMTGGRSRRSRKRRRGTCTNARRSVGAGQASDGLQTANKRTIQSEANGSALHRRCIPCCTGSQLPLQRAILLRTLACLDGTRCSRRTRRRHGIWHRHDRWVLQPIGLNGMRHLAAIPLRLFGAISKRRFTLQADGGRSSENVASPAPLQRVVAVLLQAGVVDSARMLLVFAAVPGLSAGGSPLHLAAATGNIDQVASRELRARTQSRARAHTRTHARAHMLRSAT